ncbi:MAG: NADH-quinone oxidoreductase subunit H [Rikenellaceae bacterium]
MIVLLLVFLSSLLIVGIINRARAIFAGRRGYRFFQPLRNVKVLLKKTPVYSDNASVVSRLAAPVYLASLLVAAAMLPLGSSFPALISFEGDVIVFCVMLSVGRVAIVWAAMDSGGSFAGMGAARESLFAILVEPALFLLIATLCLITGHNSFFDIFSSFNNVSISMLVLSVVVGYGFLKLSFVECSRVPVDDPRTHLELTMIHEAMVLDLAGADLAIVQMAGWLKLSIFSLLVINSVIPADIVGWDLVGFYFAGVGVFAVVIGAVESFSARSRMSKNATNIAVISAVGLLAFIVALLFKNNIIQ